MMISLEGLDMKLIDELPKWRIHNVDGSSYLREDAPEEIKKIDKELRKRYKALDFSGEYN